MPDRKEQISDWLKRIESSGLSAPRFFAKHRVPFSLAQFYRYQKAFQQSGIDGLADGRGEGNHRRVYAEAEGFLAGYLSAHPKAGQSELQDALRKRFRIEITASGMSRCLDRLGLRQKAEQSMEVRPKVVHSVATFAGFELIVALAWHFGWPQRTVEVIRKAYTRARISKHFAPSDKEVDRKGKNRRGQFTARYNRRRDVRAARFETIGKKRSLKSLESMNLGKTEDKTLARKCVAILALPLITHNGEVRTVDTAQGKALKVFCGFQYKQATLVRFLSELKYLGMSKDLLQHQVEFWREVWKGVCLQKKGCSLICYYIDGNTKALWSRKRVKKNKVTMLGRVMGCLEQVFVHDSHGHPIYFETYSGHGPMGEHVLGLFEKIEDSLEGPGPRLAVHRAIVMDAASNSVRTLRAFAAQRRYHYITSLDDNQLSPRKIRKQGRPQRYCHGAATLWDGEIELEDSKEKGYLIVTRAIRISWDRGKETCLITSLPKETIGASRVVKAYFDRWPDQELPFKVGKAVACLHRVAGYGRQELQDKKVQKCQGELSTKIATLRVKLSQPQAVIEKEEATIVRLIPKERRLRARSRVVNGRRVLPFREADELAKISRLIDKHERNIKAVRKANPGFKKLEHSEREWIRLQGKEKVYTVDVELDQIMTYFRVSLIHLYSYLTRLMGRSHLSLVSLVHSVLLLSGRAEETPNSKHVILERNEKDPQTMQALAKALVAINEMNICNSSGQKLTFALE